MNVDSSRPSFGLACWSGPPSGMSIAHQHDDIEFNLSPGTARYLIDGSVTTLTAGGLAAFWAARPHQLIGDDLPDRLFWLTVPLELLLS